jgi:hypothetical protein
MRWEGKNEEDEIVEGNAGRSYVGLKSRGSGFSKLDAFGD